RESVLPAAQRKRLAVEAGVSVYWRAFVGLDGDVVGVDRFGESAPAAAVLDYLGLTADAVYTRAKALLA
ncbi:transketolase-like TK C-terminal-containing protein, partial [Methyloversatilis discipulorum]|uniref:transketolase-like TK C-terminal-containing protein n=1 Tax=Methyloversatilis discipulorum TaxID=1119528 RepID=UPI003AF6EAF6